MFYVDNQSFTALLQNATNVTPYFLLFKIIFFSSTVAIKKAAASRRRLPINKTDIDYIA